MKFLFLSIFSRYWCYALGILLILGFQNCGKSGFQTKSELQLGTEFLALPSLGSSGLPTVPAAIIPPTSVLWTDKLFAPTSFWYQAIPADAPLHPNSEGFKADFLRQKVTFYNNVNINTTNYASPVFVVGPDVPTIKVGFNNCQNKTYFDSTLATMWSAVPIPSYALPATGTDAEMTIYQPSTDSLWEMWKAVKAADGSWTACWGGKMSNVSKNLGVFPGGYGTTATSLPFAGGQITAEELQRGEIRHAIGIALVEAENFNIYSWPAHRSDGYNPAPKASNRIPEGLRFRIDPTVDVETLPMSPIGKIIARAAQKYGFVVWDKAGSISIRAQAPVSYTYDGSPNPYTALFGKQAGYQVLSGLPWDKLQFLPMDYGKPLP